MNELHVATNRTGEPYSGATDIYVRAMNPQGKIVTADISQLDTPSLRAYLTDHLLPGDKGNPVAENTVLILLGLTGTPMHTSWLHDANQYPDCEQCSKEFACDECLDDYLRDSILNGRVMPLTEGEMTPLERGAEAACESDAMGVLGWADVMEPVNRAEKQYYETVARNVISAALDVDELVMCLEFLSGMPARVAANTIRDYFTGVLSRIPEPPAPEPLGSGVQ